MRMEVGLFGGYGRAVYDDATLGRVGDRLVPQLIEVRVPGGTMEPDLGLTIEVRQGVPVYTEVTLRSRPGGVEVRSKDLEYVALNDWLEQIVAACSWSGGGAFAVTSSRPAADAVANVRRVRSGRRRTPPDRSERVASIYREHIDARPTEAVQRAFGVSHRTAARYVQDARKAGLLPPTTPGVRNA